MMAEKFKLSVLSVEKYRVNKGEVWWNLLLCRNILRFRFCSLKVEWNVIFAQRFKEPCCKWAFSTLSELGVCAVRIACASDELAFVSCQNAVRWRNTAVVCVWTSNFEMLGKNFRLKNIVNFYVASLNCNWILC